ncbi:MAG TPA: hypothetical protein VER03_07220 [Bryobacteraceae bacterium]|nr:hypothetical protein [Bryobacteraceae bacterium]
MISPRQMLCEVVRHSGQFCWIQQPNVDIQAGGHAPSPEPGGGMLPLATRV